MQRRGTLAALIALIGVVVCVVVLGDREPRAGKTAQGAHGASSGATELGTHAVSSPRADGAPERAHEVRESVRDESGGSPEADVLVVEVVDRATGAPVADAEVSYREVPQPGGVRLGSWSFRRPRRDAPRARTDARGLVRFAVSREQTVEVTAEAPRRLAQLEVPADSGGGSERRVRVQALADWDLAVEVVDAAGAPVADVAVQCALRTGAGTPHALAEEEYTDRGARAVFEHVGFELARSPGVVAELGLDIPQLEPVRVTVEREPPGGAPVRIVLPALGAVEVMVLDADGRPVRDRTSVELVCVRPDGEGGLVEQLRLMHDVAARTAAGVAVFERVGLGLELELAVQGEHAGEGARLALAGPRIPGERVQAVLQLALETTVLVFRAVDERGQPIAGELSVGKEHQHAGAWSSTSLEVSTDAEGVFEIAIEPWLRGERRLLAVEAPECGLAASLDLSRDFPLARVEMGELVLTPPPLVAEGRVVDTAGRPIEDAVVLVSEARVFGADGELHFARLHDARARTGADGAFRLARRVDGDIVRLELVHPGFLAEPLEVAPGTRGIELIAVGTGGLAGRLLTDSLLRPRVYVRGGAGSAPAKGAAHEADGGFLFATLVPDTYTLSVAVGDDVLIEVGDLVVTAGEVTRDPRIQALDLRGRLHAFTLVLIPPEPDRDLRGTVHFAPAGRGEPERREFFFGTKVTVLAVEPRIDATLKVQGFRAERLIVSEPRTEVRLRPGIEVVLALPPDLELPARGARIGAALGELGSFSSTFDERGELRCTAYEAGRTRVHWFLARYSENTMTSGPLTLPTEHHVDVRDVEGEQRFELPVTNADLAAALTPR
jgi:hypothetical protein